MKRERKGPARQRQAKSEAADVLKARRPAEFQATFIGEPQLSFGREHRCVDPKVGLALYGPVDSDDAGRRTAVRIGLIGTGHLVDLTRAWFARCQSTIPAIRRRLEDGVPVRVPMDPVAVASFPGVPEAFGTQFVLSDSMIETLRPQDVASVDHVELFEPRVTRLVEIVVDRLRVLADKPTRPDVVICALPTALRKLCTIPSKHKRREAPTRTLTNAIRESLARDERRGQPNLFDVAALHGINLEELGPKEHVVFHHGLKARAMELDMPTQLVWEATLEGATTVEDDATRAWNFWTGMYYKAGGIPWRVTGLSPGTCYVGLSFYRDKSNALLRTCMAQAFPGDQAEGFVLRSEPFKWDGSMSPHLPKDLAADLVKRVTDAYEAHRKQRPSRVVLHKWQRYWPEERAGFEEALTPLVHSFDLVAFGDRGLRFFRSGQEPPLRGTMIPLGPANALLYTRGYVPFLGEYSGMRIPRPLEVVEHFGTAALTQICREILALTKLDWNSAAFGAREPITTAFSEDVGLILAELPPHIVPKTQYRFYM